MDYLDDAVDAIGNLLCEAAFAGFDAAVDQHQASRATGAELRDGAVAHALLGPCINRLLQEITGKAIRKTVPRFNAWLADAYGFQEEFSQADWGDVDRNRAHAVGLRHDVVDIVAYQGPDLSTCRDNLGDTCATKRNRRG